MATTEVTEILGLVDFIQEVNVYGVQVPGTAQTTQTHTTTVACLRDLENLTKREKMSNILEYVLMSNEEQTTQFTLGANIFVMNV